MDRTDHLGRALNLTPDVLLAEFNRILGVRFVPPAQLWETLCLALGKLEQISPLPFEVRQRLLLGCVNEKFDLNHAAVQEFLSFAAAHTATFNYHEKAAIRYAFDFGEEGVVVEALRKDKVLTSSARDGLRLRFTPIPASVTVARLHDELKCPTLTRKDSKPRNWSDEILSSLLAAFLYSSFSEQTLHELADQEHTGNAYQPDFWTHLHRNLPSLFSRDCALALLRTEHGSMPTSRAFQEYRNELLRRIQAIHQRMANHGYIALLIEPLRLDGEDIRWQLYADIVLYGEKHLASRVTQQYFRREQIEATTRTYIPALDVSQAQFDVVFDGLRYLDCFVLGADETQRLLVILQKSQADETPIPCPRCRSNEVQSNSYPSLGVRSFECGNPLCRDRSKFNRGKRYSFLQLLKQRGIEESENTIPKESVRAWARDVQPLRSDWEVLDMLIRHYSLVGDTVRLWNWTAFEKDEWLGRRLVAERVEHMPDPPASDGIGPEQFWDAAYFRRYVVEDLSPEPRSQGIMRKEGGTMAFLGNAADILARMSAESVDGAVTSPPYYNAREYSQWDNIYTYLFDMYNVNREVFRVLRRGGIYLFNIFDYFDNERTVSMSAMGDKRLILGAYVVDLFRRIGFNCIGNVIWDKGEIEGKRGFNGGNFSPFYQAPFNCWEHIFVFQKPGGKDPRLKFPNLLKCKPVVKMVRGKNVHGHTAPFPLAIPALLASQLTEGSIILDPFAGSMTTALAAVHAGHRAICVELNKEYFELGLRNLKEQQRQQSLI